MRKVLASTLTRLARPTALALALGCGALSLAAPVQAGGWHGGGGGWHGGWHGGGGCCWGGGSSFSLFFGFPGYYSYPAYAYYPPYPYPAYSYAPAYYPPSPPVVMAQQAPLAPPGPAPVQYWYYCNNPRGYYPYVQNCGAAWRPVPAQPPGVPTP